MIFRAFFKAMKLDQISSLHGSILDWRELGPYKSSLYRTGTTLAWASRPVLGWVIVSETIKTCDSAAEEINSDKEKNK